MVPPRPRRGFVLEGANEPRYWQDARDPLGGVRNPGRPGILYGKPAHACTREEIVEEIWAQFKQARGVLRAFRTEEGRTIDDLKYTSARIWHSFQFDPSRRG